MAVEANLEGLFVGADQVVSYTDQDNPPTNMAGWTVVLDFRKKDTSTVSLLAVTGTVSGVYNDDPLVNTQEILFPLSAAQKAATVFKGDDPTVRYSFKRTNAGAEMPLRYGDAPLIRVTQV